MLGRFAIRRALQSTAAFVGLLLMVTCFIWMVSRPRPTSPAPAAQSGTSRGSFSTVVLDPGHGGQDSGAMCGSILEKDLTLDVAQRVDRLLQAEGISTLMTRSDDNHVSLADRARFANRVPDCIFVSIHFNEGQRPLASGVETYYADHQSIPVPSFISWIPFVPHQLSDSPSVESQSLASFIQEALVARTHSTDRGAKAQQFFVIRNVTHPAVLVEGGFLTSKEELARLANTDYREQLAAAISDGILRYREVINQGQATLAVTAPAGR
jgi:N-acetylmuramoyl-L-alanine amidase